MYAAILHALAGGSLEDDDAAITGEYERRPYAEVDATEYLDGHTVYDGTLAGHVTVDQPHFYTDADVENPSLHVDTDSFEKPAVTEFVADLEAGWAGVDSSDGAELLQAVLLGQLSCIPERTEIDLPAVAETLPDDAVVEGVVTSEEEDEDGRDAAAALWHDDAPRRSSIPSSGLTQLSVRYRWDGYRIKGTIAASGYVAVYSDIPIEAFARWVSEIIWPETVHGRGDVVQQMELDSADECTDCGRESDDLEPLAIAPVEGPLCVVCRDNYREADGGMGGVES